MDWEISNFRKKFQFRFQWISISISRNFQFYNFRKELQFSVARNFSKSRLHPHQTRTRLPLLTFLPADTRPTDWKSRLKCRFITSESRRNPVNPDQTPVCSPYSSPNVYGRPSASGTLYEQSVWNGIHLSNGIKCLLSHTSQLSMFVKRWPCTNLLRIVIVRSRCI